MAIGLLLAQKIAQLFLILLSGFVLVRTRILRVEDGEPLSKLVIWLMLPCVIIASMQIDLTPEMIEEGKALIKRHGAPNAELLVMDAEHPDFPDETFDAVIARNLTWTLPHPVDAYQEWYRVLKTGGVLLNYDAEYAKGFHTFGRTENLAHKDLSKDLVEQCHDIYHMLSISSFDRPAWDLEVLPQIGFREVTVDTTVSDRIYAVKDEFYTPDRVFGIRAVK